MDPGGRRFDDRDAAVAQLLVHERLDAIDGAGRLRDDLGPFVAGAGVVPAGPERDVARAAPEDEPRPIGQPDHDVVEIGRPAAFVAAWSSISRPGIADRDRRVVTELLVRGAEARPAQAGSRPA